MNAFASQPLGLLVCSFFVACASTEDPGGGEAPLSSASATTTPTPPGPGSAVLATDGCRLTDERSALARTDPSDTFVLARVEPRVGCFGGKWLLGETLEPSPRDVFVGASSAGECSLWGDALPRNATFAIVRQRQTAGVFHLNDPCFVDDAGRPPATDRSTLGLVLYSDEATARAALAAAKAR